MCQNIFSAFDVTEHSFHYDIHKIPYYMYQIDHEKYKSIRWKE